MSSDFLQTFLNRRGQSISGPLFETLTEIAQRPTDPLSATDVAATQPSSQAAAPALPRVDDVAAYVPEPRLSAGAGAGVIEINLLDTLTECLDTADCPKTARRLYRLLFAIGMTVLKLRGLHNHLATQVAFHLPLDLVAAHLEVNRTTVWRNLKPLMTAGVLAQRDHYGTLRGETAVTGKVWVLSLRPHEIVSGTRDAVRVRHDDLVGIKWRDLDKDARQGRTAYAVLERTKAAKEKQDEMLQKGELFQLQQSLETEEAKVSEKDLLAWALAPFLPDDPSVTLTDAIAFFGGLDTVYAIPSLCGLKKAERSAAVSECARQLAAMFSDSQNLRFWTWMLWQMLRLHDQGQDVSEDICVVLARVYQDLKTYPARCPAAVVASELAGAGLYDRLTLAGNRRVGGPPATS